MFRKLSNSWELVKASAAVLRADKELLLFPIVSLVGVVVVSVLFFVPVAMTGIFTSVFFEQASFLTFAPLLVFYVAQYCMIFYANTALVGAALIRLRGGDPTLADGFRIANSRIASILGYAFISATVGMILKLVSERKKGIGRLVIQLLGMAWTIGTYLVVPILAVEEVGPIQAIKRSVELLKKTWGEQIVGNLSLGAITGLFAFGLIFLGFGIGIAGFMLQLPVAVIVVGLLFVFFALLLVGLVDATLTGIYTAAVYQFAAEGQVEGFFDADMIRGAFIDTAR